MSEYAGSNDRRARASDGSSPGPFEIPPLTSLRLSRLHSVRNLVYPENRVALVVEDRFVADLDLFAGKSIQCDESLRSILHGDQAAGRPRSRVCAFDRPKRRNMEVVGRVAAECSQYAYKQNGSHFNHRNSPDNRNTWLVGLPDMCF